MTDEQLIQAIYQKVAQQIPQPDGIFPYIAEAGQYLPEHNQNIHLWTNGFYPGILWQLNHYHPSAALQTEATRIENAFSVTQTDFEHLDHDVGFLWGLSAVARYQTTGERDARVRGLRAAIVLASRFNLAGRFIRAWNGEKRNGWTIIDSLMNMPLLYWASAELNDPRFAQIATAHINTLAHTHLRTNGATYHVVHFDADTGEFLGPLPGQGYAPDSVWSRGQAWAVYGFALAYQHSHLQAHLDAARHAADYFIAQVQKTGWLSLVDFEAPAKPEVYDLSADACAACGLMAIADETTGLLSQHYRDAASAILQAITAKDVDVSATHAGILQRTTSAYDRQSEYEKPIIYGDYFLVEALLRAQHQAITIW